MTRKKYTYYFYIITSKKYSRRYIGIAEDIKLRILQHNNGSVKSTKPFLSWRVVYYEAHLNKTLARKSEIFYKSSQGRRQLKKKFGIE